MKKRRIGNSNKNNKNSVDDIKNKVLKDIRKELMAGIKKSEHSGKADDIESTPVNEPTAKDNIANTLKKRGRKKKGAELIKETDSIKEDDSLSVEDDIDYSQIKEPKSLKLKRAKKAKNDEFYTDCSEIEKELAHYTEHFKDKVVLCNCDGPYYSEFWKYFKARFKTLELKRLIGTHYDNENLPSYAIEFSRDERYSLSYEDSKKLRERYNTIDFDLNNIRDCKIHWLNGDGDFRSEECLEYLKKCDIVVTNPPFSLFREFISVMNNHSKKFVTIGDLNSVAYKEVFKLIMSNRIWSGYSHPKEFRIKFDGGDTRKFGNKMWFTNLEIKKRYEDLILYKTYNTVDYTKYDNYDAINVDKVKDIPIDYDGVIGVPISFIDKYNPDQFEIVGLTLKSFSGEYYTGGLDTENPVVNGVAKYRRMLIIKREKNNE